MLVAEKKRLMSLQAAMEEANKLSLENTAGDPDMSGLQNMSWCLAMDHNFKMHYFDKKERDILRRVTMFDRLQHERQAEVE